MEVARTKTNMKEEEGNHFEFFKIYSHICKIFGCFPIKFQPDSTVVSFGKVATLYAVIMAVVYSLSTFDGLKALTVWCQRQNCSMSDTILLFPQSIATGISDIIIHLTSLLYCHKLMELTQLLRKSDSAREGRSTLDIAIYVGLLLNGLHAVAYKTVIVTWYGTQTFSAFCDNSSTCQDIGIFLSKMCLNLWHRGAILCAATFVAIFGRRLVTALKKYCVEIKSAALQGGGHLEVAIGGNMNRAAGTTIFASRASEIRAVAKMRDDFVELQRGFSNFSVIAGLFSMAIVIETMVQLYSLVWFALSLTSNVAQRGFDGMQTVMLLILLSIIIETGDYMRTEV